MFPRGRPGGVPGRSLASGGCVPESSCRCDTSHGFVYVNLEVALCGCAAQPGLGWKPAGNLSAWSNPGRVQDRVTANEPEASATDSNKSQLTRRNDGMRQPLRRLSVADASGSLTRWCYPLCPPIEPGCNPQTPNAPNIPQPAFEINDETLLPPVPPGVAQILWCGIRYGRTRRAAWP
jgi:hypothetical protein